MKAEITLPPELMDAITATVLERVRRELKPTPPPAQVEPLMGLVDTARYLGGVSKDWLYQRTAKNEIPFVKVGRHVRFNRAEIDRWLAKQAVPAVAPLSTRLSGKQPRDFNSR